MVVGSSSARHSDGQRMTSSGGIDVSTMTTVISPAAGVQSGAEAANTADVSAKMVRYHESTGVLRTAGRPGRRRG